MTDETTQEASLLARADALERELRRIVETLQLLHGARWATAEAAWHRAHRATPPDQPRDLGQMLRQKLDANADSQESRP